MRIKPNYVYRVMGELQKESGSGTGAVTRPEATRAICADRAQ